MLAQWAFVGALALLANALTAEAAVRQVHVAANEVIWDYAPSGSEVNLCAGGPYVDGATALYVAQGLGSRYWKALYQEYQDGSFQVRLAPLWFQEFKMGGSLAHKPLEGSGSSGKHHISHLTVRLLADRRSRLGTRMKCTSASWVRTPPGGCPTAACSAAECLAAPRVIGVLAFATEQ